MAQVHQSPANLRLDRAQGQRGLHRDFFMAEAAQKRHGNQLTPLRTECLQGSVKLGVRLNRI